MKPYRATLRLLHDYDRALVEVIQFLDSYKHSNEPVRDTVDTLLNHSDKLKKAVELELQSNETGVRTTEC
jgi:predicted nucleic-acid-binding protein